MIAVLESWVVDGFALGATLVTTFRLVWLLAAGGLVAVSLMRWVRRGL